MFNKEMINKLLLPIYNPLKYFSHLSAIDKDFVLTEILPKINYDQNRKLTIPKRNIFKEKPSISKYDIPDMHNGSKVVYRTFRNLYPNKMSDSIFITAESGTEVCSDYERLIRFIPEECMSTSIEHMISAITEITFEGLNTFSVLLEAYADIFKKLRIYEITPVLAGLEESFKSLQIFLELKTSSFAPINTENMMEYVDQLNEIDAYINGDLNKEKNHIAIMILSIIQFYTSSSSDYDNEKIWNTFPMLVLKQKCEDIDGLRSIFNFCFDSTRNPQNIPLDYGKNLEKVLNNISLDFNKDISDIPDENWLSKYPITTQISYENLSKLSSGNLIDQIFDKTGIHIQDGDVNFDISEELLTMYLAEYNVDYPIILPEMDEDIKYKMIYENKFYALFQLNSDSNKLYGASCELNDPINDSYTVTLLEFKKNPDYNYIFKYE